MNRIWTVVVSILFMGVVLSLATIPDMEVPNTFTAGTKAVATQVNENFNTVELDHNNMIDSLRARIQTDTILSNPHCDSITIDMKLYGNATADSLTISNVIISDGVAALDTLKGNTQVDTLTIDMKLYGNATADSLVITTGDINGGTIDGTTIGAASATTGKFTMVTADSADITTFDTVRATYGDFTLQDTLKSNVTKGDSLTYIGNDTTRFKITKAGNVGFGTIAPFTRTGFSAPWLTITSTSPGINLVDVNNSNVNRYISNNAGLLEIGKTNDDGTLDTTHVSITSTGNVGIDTTAPASKLHVAGSLRVRDTLICGTWNHPTVLTENLIVSKNVSGICYTVENTADSLIKIFGSVALNDDDSVTLQSLGCGNMGYFMVFQVNGTSMAGGECYIEGSTTTLLHLYHDFSGTEADGKVCVYEDASVGGTASFLLKNRLGPGVLPRRFVYEYIGKNYLD